MEVQHAQSGNTQKISLENTPVADRDDEVALERSQPIERGRLVGLVHRLAQNMVPPLDELGDVLFDQTEHVESFDGRRTPDLIRVEERGLMLSERRAEMIQDDAAIDVSIEEQGDVHGWARITIVVTFEVSARNPMLRSCASRSYSMGTETESRVTASGACSTP